MRWSWYDNRIRIAQSQLFGIGLKESDKTSMQDAFEFLSYEKEKTDLQNAMQKDAQSRARTSQRRR